MDQNFAKMRNWNWNFEKEVILEVFNYQKSDARGKKKVKNHQISRFALKCVTDNICKDD